MSRPSGESEANTVTGSTSAGSLGEQNTRSYSSVVFHIAETIVFIGKKIFFCMGADVCLVYACVCIGVCIGAHASMCMFGTCMHVFALVCALALTHMCVWRPEPGARLLPLLLGILLWQGLSLNLEFIDLIG